MDNVFFTSDPHFFHKSILHLGPGRPFYDVDYMNETLIERWNSRVTKSDRIYMLGDFSFGNVANTREVLKRLHGQKHFIRGNHDGTLDTVLKREPELVQSYEKYKEIKIGQQRLVLFHFPILSWHQMHKGSWMLHGHCHGNLTFDNGPMLDVGVDCHNFAPIEFSEVEVLLKDREIKLYDHHTPDRE